MHVLITGASKGIGFATARCFVDGAQNRPWSRREPLRLSICSRNATELADARAKLLEADTNLQIHAQPCDVSDSEEVQSFLTEAERAFGPVDVLINNAGFGIFLPVTETSEAHFQAVLATNLRGVFLMTRAVLPSMRMRKAGAVVTICSIAGKQGFAGGSAYCAAKFGVRGLMQSLALEVREEGIRVITAFPGNVDTNFFAAAGLIQDQTQYLAAGDVGEMIYACVELPARACVSEFDIRQVARRV